MHQTTSGKKLPEAVLRLVQAARKQVAYEGKPAHDGRLRARRYSQGCSCQQLARVWQTYAAPDTVVDLDITNCCFVLLLQVLDKLEPQHPQWPGVRETLRECAQERDVVMRHKLKTVPEVGKHLLIKVFNGGLPPQDFEKNEFILKLQRASTFCRWVAASLLPEFLEHEMECKPHPDSPCLFYLWSAVEDMLLDVWIDKLQALRLTAFEWIGLQPSRMWQLCAVAVQMLFSRRLVSL